MRYVTFGQNHVHSINGKTFDKDCVALVDGDRDKVFEIFGTKFCFEYTPEYWESMKKKDNVLRFFSRGVIEVDT